MDPADYEEIAEVLHGLLVRLDDRLQDDDVTEIAEFIDANELGIALELMASALMEDDRPLLAQERSDMLALAARMQISDRVLRTLEFCPER